MCPILIAVYIVDVTLHTIIIEPHYIRTYYMGTQLHVIFKRSSYSRRKFLKMHPSPKRSQGGTGKVTYHASITYLENECSHPFL